MPVTTCTSTHKFGTPVSAWSAVRRWIPGQAWNDECYECHECCKVIAIHRDCLIARHRKTKMESILIIDDDETFNSVLSRALVRRGFAVSSAASPKEALDAAQHTSPDRVVLDLNLAGQSGLGLIEPLLAINGQCRIIVLTGYASIATAVDAIKLGATQYLAKPVDVDTLLVAFAANDRPQPAVLASAEPLSVGRLAWEHIQRVLHENGGNISATARVLKMHRRTLQRKLAKRPLKN